MYCCKKLFLFWIVRNYFKFIGVKKSERSTKSKKIWKNPPHIHTYMNTYLLIIVFYFWKFQKLICLNQESNQFSFYDRHIHKMETNQWFLIKHKEVTQEDEMPSKHQWFEKRQLARKVIANFLNFAYLFRSVNQSMQDFVTKNKLKKKKM